MTFSWQQDKPKTSLSKNQQFSWQQDNATANKTKVDNKHFRVLAGKQQGISHLADDTPCEDFYCIEKVDELNGTAQTKDMLLIFVADGAGSAIQGGEGARLVCQWAMNFAKQFLTVSQLSAESNAQSPHNYQNRQGLPYDIVTHIHSKLDEHIEQFNATTNHHNEVNRTTDEKTDSKTNGKIERKTTDKIKLPLTARDFACTLMGVIITKEQTLLMQVGDGAIVVNFSKEDAGLYVPIMPMQGEYANMTHFVTDRQASEYLSAKVYDDTPTQLAVMTDGLQRLALNLADFSPHLPFFAPFFDALTHTEDNETGEQALQIALDDFLDSKLVNARTDDDKTIVLVQKV